jgi:hypothetical protein
MMSDDAHELLEPHARRKLRTFMRAPDPGNHSDSKVWDAFYAVLYGRDVVTHDTALAVEAELKDSERTIGDVLAGWKPAALERTS